MERLAQKHSDSPIDLQLAETVGQELGQDFLTWLWAATELEQGRFMDQDGHFFELYVEQKVTVQGGQDQAREVASSSGPLSEFKEAKEGLKMGKKVSQVQFRVEQDSQVWQFQVRAQDFCFSGLRTPKVETKVEEGEDPDGPVLEKLYLLEKGYAFFDALFNRFLELRFGKNWSLEQARIESWLTGKEVAAKRVSEHG